MNKLLFASRRPVYPFIIGGAEVSFHEICKVFSQNNYNILNLGELDCLNLKMHNFSELNNEFKFKLHNKTIKYSNLEISEKCNINFSINESYKNKCTTLSNWNSFVEEEINSFNPDVILTQLDGALEVIQIAEKYKIPVIHFIRDTFNPINILPYFDRLKFNKTPDVTISNSQYVSNWFFELTNRKSEVVYPAVNSQFITRTLPNKNKKEILFINPTEYKGLDIVKKLIKLLPNINFKIVPSWNRKVPEELSLNDNVEIINSYIDNTRLYQTSDIVIVPSQQPEAFGRVAIEAQSFGIPVIASNHSGFKEVLRDTAILIDNYEDVNAWLMSVNKLISSEELKKNIINKGIKNAFRFQPSNTFYKIDPLIKRLIN